MTPRRIGEKFGQEHVTLTAANVPAHTHTAKLHAKDDDGDTSEPSGAALAKSENTFKDDDPDAEMHDGSVTVDENTGGNQPFNNVQPTLYINFVIALVGIFPSRS